MMKNKSSLQTKKKRLPSNWGKPRVFGGGLGIRTLGPFRNTTFRESHHRPLGQPSNISPNIRSQKSLGKRRELMERTWGIKFSRWLSIASHVNCLRIMASRYRIRFRDFHLRPLGHLSSTKNSIPSKRPNDNSLMNKNKFGWLIWVTVHTLKLIQTKKSVGIRSDEINNSIYL